MRKKIALLVFMFCLFSMLAARPVKLVPGYSPDGQGWSFPGSVAMGIPHLVQAATDTLTAAECKGYVITNYGQLAENTQTLPAAATGLSGMLLVGTAGAGALHLKAGAGNKIYLSGTALDDADKVSIATPVVGNYLMFFSFQTGASAWDWIVIPAANTVASDGGA